MNYKTIQTASIRPDPEQPRKTFDDDALARLQQSIQDVGIEHPILVRQNGKGFIIVDGERRWRAATAAGVKNMPCVVTDNEQTLEQQLRSDCLKEELTVDELDQAIYRYYESIRTSSDRNCNRDKLFTQVADAIGKSDNRVRIAIDRFEFKRSDEKFTSRLEKDHNPDGKKYSRVNSSIAMTSPLKNQPEVRKAILENMLDNTPSRGSMFNNDHMKDVVSEIAKKNITSPQDAIAIMNHHKAKLDLGKTIKSDPRFVFTEFYNKLAALKDEFDSYNFITVKEHVHGTYLDSSIDMAEDLLSKLKELEA